MKHILMHGGLWAGCAGENISFPLEEILQDSFREWVTFELPTQGWISRQWPSRKGTKEGLLIREKRGNAQMHRGDRHPAGCETLQGRDSVYLVHYCILCAKLMINKTNLIKQNNEWISSIWRVWQFTGFRKYDVWKHIAEITFQRMFGDTS